MNRVHSTGSQGTTQEPGERGLSRPGQPANGNHAGVLCKLVGETIYGIFTWQEQTGRCSQVVCEHIGSRPLEWKLGRC